MKKSTVTAANSYVPLTVCQALTQMLCTEWPISFFLITTSCGSFLYLHYIDMESEAQRKVH